MAIIVEKNRCPQNHPCPSIRVCPVGALKQQGYKAPTVDAAKCTECGKCVSYCPMGAIRTVKK
ncbi:4Fe-4S binding protein [Syntrophobotulus glycolicus]|uniref:4Fe-4S binding protein n=1 Tax=Syntrophobotulus glycolicus TaxID=51197 RepID=UPI0009FF2565|nr:4Fe-4S binding protein [Syntrophobotulus glycolicus]